MKYRKKKKMPEKKHDKYAIEISQQFKRDLAEIIGYIAQNSPLNATKIKKRIQVKINTLEHFPYRGSYVPELLAHNNKDYRQITESPWKIVYRVDEKIVRILAIVDTRRDLQDVLLEKLLK